MKRFLKSFRRGEKGFTLIELLVVIAILGIIAAIVVPNLAQFRGTATETACEIEDRMVRTATMAYAADKGECPLSTSDLGVYFEPGYELMGEYTFEVDPLGYPNCVVTQSACPK